MHWLARWYARRIVNVNVNIIVAGLLALPPVVLTVHLVQYFGIKPDETFTIGIARLGWSMELYVISVLTLIADLFFDFTIYMGLHWLANHGSWRKHIVKPAGQILDAADRGLSFVHDAGLVQFERAVLSPLLYAVWLWLQHALIKAGWSAESATAVGAVCGIAMARVLHTAWMLRQERVRARAALRASATPSP